MWDHGAMSHGVPGVQGHGGHAMDMGRVHGGGRVRAGRAERAGMHRGPLKGRGKRAWGKGCVGSGSHVGSWGHELEPGSRAWSRD